MVASRYMPPPLVKREANFMLTVRDNNTEAVLFALEDEEYQVGDKLRFTFENNPIRSAELEVTRIDGKNIFVNGPALVITRERDAK